MYQRFRESHQSCLWLRHGSMCLSEERQKIRPQLLCSCGTIVHHALGDLLDAFLRLSLVCQRPATQDSTTRFPDGKSLFLSEADGGFDAFLGCLSLPTVLMEHGSNSQDITQAIGVRHLLCQRQRFAYLCLFLVRIPKIPQRPRVHGTANHLSVVPIEERIDTVLLGVV